LRSSVCLTQEPREPARSPSIRGGSRSYRRQTQVWRLRASVYADRLGAPSVEFRVITADSWGIQVNSLTSYERCLQADQHANFAEYTHVRDSQRSAPDDAANRHVADKTTVNVGCPFEFARYVFGAVAIDIGFRRTASMSVAGPVRPIREERYAQDDETSSSNLHRNFGDRANRLGL
jgi:hypothetical protein